MATTASDNNFPKIIGVEQGADPAAPAAGTRKLYAKADGWYDEDSAGTVVGPLGVGGGGGGGTSFVGNVPVVFPVGVSPMGATVTSYDATAGRARLYVVSIPGQMRVRRLAASVGSAGAGIYDWGLFDFSVDATACTKVAGGSGAFSSAGWASIAASSAPVTVNPGNYALILKAPASGFANLTRAAGSVADSWHKYRDGYTWSDTPDITTGWATQPNLILCGLFGDLDATHQW